VPSLRRPDQPGITKATKRGKCKLKFKKKSLVENLTVTLLFMAYWKDSKVK